MSGEFEKFLRDEPMIMLGGFSQDIARAAWNAALAAAMEKMPRPDPGSTSAVGRAANRICRMVLGRLAALQSPEQDS